MIDLHSHILSWLDDGSRDLDESLAIARSMADDGTEIVAATPHVRDDYPTTPAGMNEALARVREAAAQAGIQIDVRGGGEIALDRLEHLDVGALAAFGFGGNPRLLLLEYPYDGHPLFLVRDCQRLRHKGIVPVIVHPERNRAIQERPADLESVVQAGAVVQLTAASRRREARSQLRPVRPSAPRPGARAPDRERRPLARRTAGRAQQSG